jgi:hypothetical protein
MTAVRIPFCHRNDPRKLDAPTRFAVSYGALQKLVDQDDYNRTVDNSLSHHAAGFMVRTQGHCTDGAVAQFRHFLKLRRLEPDTEALAHALAQAQQEYFSGKCRLSICAAQPCCNNVGYDVSEQKLSRLSGEIGAAIVKTGCQGPCKQAPVLALRVGDRQEFFIEVAHEEDWRAVLKFAQAAVRANSLLVETAAAEKFRFDPVHNHDKPSAHMKPLEFLLGHFRGEGRYAMADYAFDKEVIGSFEAGGRFLALRMDAAYPLADGRKDVHKALVIVGSESSGAICAHAYTDGGQVCEYTIERRDEALEFADAAPGHASQWKRARKTLRPTIEGFEERLEVDPGSGFVPYYVIQMKRLD